MANQVNLVRSRLRKRPSGLFQFPILAGFFFNCLARLWRRKSAQRLLFSLSTRHFFTKPETEGRGKLNFCCCLLVSLNKDGQRNIFIFHVGISFKNRKRKH